MNITSRGHICRITELGDAILVSFAEHDGYFRVEMKDLCALIRNAQSNTIEIVFTYDQNLLIDAASSVPSEIHAVKPEFTPFTPLIKG